MGIFFFFFKKHWTSLNFRPFTNIFLGQKRRRKNPTKCLSQLLTSTMNHGHKTTAMWLTKKLCVFTSRYWKSFSNLCYVICRQTDGCTDTPLWVLSRQSYNHGHRMTTFHPFSLSNPFLENYPTRLKSSSLAALQRWGVVCVCARVHTHTRVCMPVTGGGRLRHQFS